MKPKCCDCCYPGFVSSEFCGCCEGIEILTPLATVNRPGLSQLAYRIGTHGSFLETMKARLSSKDFPALKALTTRASDDPSLAFLDAWATVADVLTFYQERIANEGYLRTATERRSILELARLVGYKLRPGVASSVYLAYTIDENTQEEVTIPAGSRAQSLPGPGEQPQSFETSEELKARAGWNNLQPRLTRPQTAASIKNASEPEVEQTVQEPRIYLKGISTNLTPNDPLLIDFGTDDDPEFHRVKSVEPDAAADRTLVTLQATADSQDDALIAKKDLADQGDLIKALTVPPSIQPRNSLRLRRNLKEQFSAKAGAGYAAVSAFTPVLRETLTTAVANANVTPESGIKVYALRVEAAPFGHNMPLTPPPLPTSPPVPIITDVSIADPLSLMALDAEYKEIKKGSWVVVEREDTSGKVESRRSTASSTEEVIATVEDVKAVTLGGEQENADLSFFSTYPAATTIAVHDGSTTISFGEPVKMRVTLLTLSTGWLDNKTYRDKVRKEILRNTTVYAQSEELELAEEPINSSVCGGTDDPIELDGFYEGLEAGRWVIASGERDIKGTSGVRFSELAMLASVSQSVQAPVNNEALEGAMRLEAQGSPRPGDKTHTYIKLANRLAYCFKRDTVKIHGNVVKATHGETREEVLGSGDASKALQSFDLKQAPLTFVSASNPSGVDSTLNVFVNDIHWHEADSLVGLQPADHSFITKTNDEQKTTVIFGNGEHGARPPTGIENIRAKYRSGIGKPGNVRAEQITLLATKPLGAKEVINPLRASGGADRESRDQARKNAPLAVKALDRLVSVQDYEDFSRIYAGIGKAMAVELSDGRRQIVHVTIAGADDIPIDENSDLFQNLYQALHDFGDPFQPIQLVVRELMLIVISANVRILPDYQWEPVVTQLRAALLDAFSFERRELGQDVLLSEVISVMQKVRGVAYVDVDTLGGIPEKIEENGERRLLTPDEIVQAVDCLATQWSDEDMEGKCSSPAEAEDKECIKYKSCKRFGTVETKKGVRQRLRVNVPELKSSVNGGLLPAQIAFLSPEAPATLILNRIE